MEGTYKVFFGGQNVGNVRVSREGLYYCFHCRCRLSGEIVCKLIVTCGDVQVHLGVLIPTGEGFGLETKVPAKRLGEGEPSFHIQPNRVIMEGRFIPIKPEEPFAYIARLKEAFLARQEGQPGAVIKM